MASASITTVGGVVVITQVIPQDGTSIPLQNPVAVTAQQAPPPAPTSPVKMDDMTATFLRGHPHALGVVQIVIGVMCILFSLTAAFSQFLIVHASLCLSVAFVVSGSLVLVAGRRTSVGLVRASLVSSLISVVVGLAGAIYLCWLLAHVSLSLKVCDDQRFSDPGVRIRCTHKIRSLDAIMYELYSFHLILLVLQTCVTITVCVFCGKALRRHNMAKVNDYSSLLSGAALDPSDDVSLLDSDGSETSGLPPNSP